MFGDFTKLFGILVSISVKHPFLPVKGVTCMTNFNHSKQQQYSHYPQNDGYYASQRQQSHRVLYPDNRRPYFGGFDAGSGFAELWVAPVDNPEQVAHVVIPSWVASGSLDDITKRSHLLEA